MQIKVDSIFQIADDSWYVFDKATGGIKYRLSQNFVGIFNASIKQIADDAAKVAASYTPFQYFRNAWEAKTTLAGHGIIGMIMISNKLVNSRMPYRSQWSNSGKTFYFPIKNAITMLETGRKQGYPINARNKQGVMTIGPSDTEQGFSFIRKAVTIRGGFFKHQPVTNAENYMKTELHNYFSSLHLGRGIRTAIPSQTFEFKKGNFTNIIRGARLGKVFARGKSKRKVL